MKASKIIPGNLPIKILLSALGLITLLTACGPNATPTISPTLAAITAPAQPSPLPTPTILATNTSAPPVPSFTSGVVSGPQLIDIGGYKLYVECQGKGSPTVVLDAGLGNTSSTWLTVARLVATFTSVCYYDRANLGRSEAGPIPRNSQQFVKELHTLLGKLKLPGPYLLVGQSLGGLNMQLYASQYPQEVAGLVLVDALHPEFDSRIEALLTPEQIKQRRQELADNPEKVSFENILESEAQVKAAGALPQVPLVVIRHGIPFDFSAGWPSEAIEKLWLQLQTELAARSSQGKLVLAAKSPHRIQEFQPSVVAEAIKEVFETTRTK